MSRTILSIFLALDLALPCWPDAAAPVLAADPFGQAQVAELARTVSTDNRTLEGAIFDDQGNLLFCDVSGKRVMQLDSKGQLSTLTTFANEAPGGLALHKDGRLFIAALNMDENRGVIVALHKDGSRQTILPADRGFWPNDMILDARGGLYFTDFRGSASQDEGGVYYLSPDGETITPVVPHLAQANGVGLSPDGRVLWVTEFAKGQLYRLELVSPTRTSAVGSNITWRFTGPAPDSLRVDALGNVYVANYRQGRVLVFDALGMPLAQIVLPRRGEGKDLLCTSLAIRPGSQDMYIVSGNPDSPDGLGADGSHLFRARALGNGQPATR